MRRSTVFREVFHWAIGAVIVVLLVQTWFALGLMLPVTVSGSSMAPTLLGPHRMSACPCGHRFAVGLDQSPEGSAWCPACGRYEASVDEPVDLGASRVFVDRTAYSFSEIRRWDVVVFRCPDDAQQLCIKRVLGLPGETVRFEGGDLWIDEQIVRKSLGEQLRLRRLVHREGGPHVRWQPQEAASGWQRIGEAWVFEPADATAAAEPDWLEYRHPTTAPQTRDGPANRTQQQSLDSGPITDELAYNQRLVRRPNVVNDLMLTLRVALGESGALVLKAEAEAGDFQVTLDLAERSITATHNGDLLAASRLPENVLSSRDANGQAAFELTLSLFDRQALVAADGEKLLLADYEPAQADSRIDDGNIDSGDTSPSAEPRPQRLAVAVKNAGARISNLAVWRDVYYETRWQDEAATIRRAETDSSLAWRLRAGEYFVVGDNQALSDDSRSWPLGPGLRESLIVGRVSGEW